MENPHLPLQLHIPRKTQFYFIFTPVCINSHLIRTHLCIMNDAVRDLNMQMRAVALNSACCPTGLLLEAELLLTANDEVWARELERWVD